MEPVTLRTARFVLSAPRASDIDAVYVACQDADIQRYTTVPAPYTMDDATGFVNDYVPQAWRDDIEYVFGIRLNEEAPLVGVISWQRARGFVGYWLAAPERGRGIMSEALGGVVEWVLRDGGVDSVRWSARVGNIGSAVVAQRAGFRWIGEGPCEVNDREGQHPWGWHAVLHRDDLGSVQSRREWPVLT